MLSANTCIRSSNMEEVRGANDTGSGDWMAKMRKLKSASLNGHAAVPGSVSRRAEHPGVREFALDPRPDAEISQI